MGNGARLIKVMSIKGVIVIISLADVSFGRHLVIDRGLCNAGARGIPTKKGLRFRCRYRPLANMSHYELRSKGQKRRRMRKQTEIYRALAENFLPLQGDQLTASAS